MMVRNYLKIAWRSIAKYKLFSGLNIIGLATGMACSIFIFLWVQYESNFDTFNENSDRIYRLTANISDVEAAVVPPPLANVLKTEVPTIENATRIASAQEIVSVGTTKFSEKRMYYADTNFLEVFNYPLLKGDVHSLLTMPTNVVITEATAIKYFGSADAAMGQVIHVDYDIKGKDLSVTGVLKNIPSNSHLKFDLLLPIELYDQINNPAEAWNNFDAYVYFLLKPSVTPSSSVIHGIESQINAIQNKNSSIETLLSAQPLTAIHLHSHYTLDVEGHGNIQYVRIFLLIAIFIIVIACINFMNLATAVSGKRAKEVGLRKTVGANRFQLAIQFIGESLLLSVISLVIAVVIVYTLLPLFNQLISGSISLDILDAKIIFMLLAIVLITGLLSGSYPAFFLSSFNTVSALKGAKMQQGRRSFFRNGLVILQFSISILLVISTLVVHRQLGFIRNMDIGYEKENLLYVQMPEVGDLKNNLDALKDVLKQYPDIEDYTFTDHLPTNLTTGTQLLWDGMPTGTQIITNRMSVDENFLHTFGMQIMAGRFFSSEFGGDESRYLVNETALKVMKMPVEEAIGKNITINDKTGPIIGVVRDFNFKPVHQPIEPLVLRANFSGGFFVVRTTPANIQKIILMLKENFKSVYGDVPFSYGFVNEDLSKLYVTEQQMGKLFRVFSSLSILISCLGLFGLTTFATQIRMKEIGVRKVLGASVTSIVRLLSQDFIKLVLIALIIASPIAWWAMNRWLDGFAYRMEIQWWMFVLSGFVAVAIAMLTVSWQAIRAAVANPVDSLRDE